MSEESTSPADSVYVRWLDGVTGDDRASVGAKGANLGILRRHGIRCPPGFCVTANASRRYFEGAAFRRWRARATDEPSAVRPEPPADIRTAVLRAYQELAVLTGRHDVVVAVRSSSPAEDSSSASFAGQYHTTLGVSGGDQVVAAIIDGWLSLFSPRALRYAERMGVRVESTAMPIVVQEMVAALAAGVLFTAHPVTADPGQMIVEAVLGLGEPLVSGQFSPDSFVVDKSTYSVSSSLIADKPMAFRYDPSSGKLTEEAVPETRARRPALGYDEISDLARLGQHLESLFGYPLDIEWVLDEKDFSIVQARPLTSNLKEGVWKSSSRESRPALVGLGESPGSYDPAPTKRSKKVRSW